MNEDIHSYANEELVDTDAAVVVGVEFFKDIVDVLLGHFQSRFLQTLRELLKTQLLVTVIVHTTECPEIHYCCDVK